MTESEPFIPEVFRRNRRGMQSDGEVAEAEQAEAVWREALADALKHARRLAELGVAKEQANRILEPFAYVRAIITSTEWDNWDALRIDSHAQGEMQTLAKAMKAARDASTPEEKMPGKWHLPYWAGCGGAGEQDWESVGGRVQDAVKVSVARCARISYLNHDGKRDIEKDLELYERLVSAGHMGALEHAAQVGKTSSREVRPMGYHVQGKELRDFCGNFRLPWVQHRKMIAGEAVFGSVKTSP